MQDAEMAEKKGCTYCMSSARLLHKEVRRLSPIAGKKATGEAAWGGLGVAYFTLWHRKRGKLFIKLNQPKTIRALSVGTTVLKLKAPSFTSASVFSSTNAKPSAFSASQRRSSSLAKG